MWAIDVLLVFLLTFTAPILSSPIQSLDFSDLITRQESGLAGYLGAFFLGDKPNVYFYLSDGNNAISFKALNKGNPVLVPTKGTQGVRDPAIISGGGSEAGKKWYIVGTDLNIGKTSWDAAQRTGSRGIFVWESTDLVNWTNERLVQVEDATAGMVWAPEALWDADKSQYMVHWASKFYSSSDTKHTGNPSATRIRYAHTSDFKNFTTPQTYIDHSPASTIDLDILPLGDSNYARFMKNESATNVFTEISINGLFGTWTRPGGAGTIIQSSVEGPAAYLDNQVKGKAHLLLDFFGGDGYHPFESTDIQAGKWSASDRSTFPKNLRHGSVLPINSSLVQVLGTKWG